MYFRPDMKVPAIELQDSISHLADSSEAESHTRASMIAAVGEERCFLPYTKKHTCTCTTHISFNHVEMTEVTMLLVMEQSHIYIYHYKTIYIHIRLLSLGCLYLRSLKSDAAVHDI